MNYVRQVMVSLACAGLLIACGGGDNEIVEPLATPVSGAASADMRADVRANVHEDVRIEGCVLDDTGPARAVTVHARGEDGRLLGSTLSNDGGVFALRVPARHSVALGTDASGPAELVVLTGGADFSIGGCLRRAAA